MTGNEIWSVVKHTFTPRNIPLETLADRIDARTDSLQCLGSGLAQAIEDVTRGKGS